jgi:hypothetical protein
MHTAWSAPRLAAMILVARVTMPMFLELRGTARRTRVSPAQSCVLASGSRVVGPTRPRHREPSSTSRTLPEKLTLDTPSCPSSSLKKHSIEWWSTTILACQSGMDRR